MSIINSKFTVLFDEPFWVGIYERSYEEKYEVSRIVFGAEPRGYEVYEFLLENWHRLCFSPVLETKQVKEKIINPKRMQREIHKQVETAYIGTKAQQALKVQQEQNKFERKLKSRIQRDEESQRKFSLRQDKKCEKHKGH